MEVLCSSEVSITANVYHSSQHYIREHPSLHLERCVNLRSRKTPDVWISQVKKKRLHTSPWNWPWRPRWGWWRYRTMPRSGHFIPGAETRHPLYRRLGGPQFQSGRVQKILTYPGYDSRIVQSVATQVSQDSQMELISISMLTSTNRVLGSGQERIQGSLLLTHCIQIESH